MYEHHFAMTDVALDIADRLIGFGKTTTREYVDPGTAEHVISVIWGLEIKMEKLAMKESVEAATRFGAVDGVPDFEVLREFLAAEIRKALPIDLGGPS